MKLADTLIHARWVIPVDTNNLVLDHHSIAIKEGRIAAILPSDRARKSFDAETVIEVGNHALIPGLVNAHTHVAMNLMRGIADDLALMDWLQNHIWPAEQRWVNEQFVHDGTQLAMAEMLRSGTTCFNDMYFFPEAMARAAAQAGMRVCAGMILIDFPTNYAADADDYFNKGLALNDEFRHHPLVHCNFAPHAPYTVSDEPLRKLQVLADELDLQVHMHVHETADELEGSQSSHGKRPLQRLADLGLLSPSMMLVHMTQVNDEDIRLVADNGAHVIHCPESNLKLASGFCPVQRLLDAGVNVALGTDGAASNNDLDMLSEMRTAALLAKAVAGDASALPASMALRMATINGARALGVGEETGSLEIGKWADITAIDLSAVETRPVFDPVSHIVYAAGREQVSDVWVAGQHLLNNRNLTQLDTTDILARADAWQSRLASPDNPLAAG